MIESKHHRALCCRRRRPKRRLPNGRLPTTRCPAAAAESSPTTGDRPALLERRDVEMDDIIACICFASVSGSSPGVCAFSISAISSGCFSRIAGFCTTTARNSSMASVNLPSFVSKAAIRLCTALGRRVRRSACRSDCRASSGCPNLASQLAIIVATEDGAEGSFCASRSTSNACSNSPLFISAAPSASCGAAFCGATRADC